MLSPYAVVTCGLHTEITLLLKNAWLYRSYSNEVTTRFLGMAMSVIHHFGPDLNISIIIG